MRLPILLLAACCLFSACGPNVEGREDPDPKDWTVDDFYRVDFLHIPKDVALEVGGMDFLANGSLVVSTRRGQVWILENPTVEDPKDAQFRLFADGLDEGLGLKVVEDRIYVVQRTELSLLRDTDGDGRCDRVETVTDDWGCSGNYHEFAFGLPRDASGNFYVGLNLGFFTPYWYIGQSTEPYRGFIMKVTPDGRVNPFAFGFRCPNGMGLNKHGELFMTDNQGDWLPTCPLHHVKEGNFYGHPASLDWTNGYRARGERADWYRPSKVPRTPAAVWLPYGLSRSTGNMIWDYTGGRFGPFGEQMFLAEVTNGLVARVQLEKVRGQYQGTAFKFREDVGAANRVIFGPDGTMYCGLTSRGWGSKGASHGISRVRFTGRTPMEMKSVSLLMDGFDIDFTLPIAGEITPEQVEVTQYDLNYWWKYGSPEVNQRKLDVLAAGLSPDRRRLRLQLGDLRQGYMTRIKLKEVESEGGIPLFNNQADYTLNQFPRGPLGHKHVARIVEPPPTREQEAQGFTQIMDDRAPLRLWEGKGWRIGSASLARDRVHLKVGKGRNAVVFEPSKSTRLSSREQLGDMSVRLEFLLPKGGTAGVAAMGRYRIDLSDSKTSGSVEGRAPTKNAAKKHGEWQRLDFTFRAPRFDADGVKTANARFEEILLNEKKVLAGVELSAEAEAPQGPLVLIGDRTQVAFRKVWVRHDSPRTDEGWQTIFDGKSLDGWKQTGKAQWKVTDEGILKGTGPTGHLFSPRSDYRNFEFRAKVRLGYKSNSGMYFRVGHKPGWPPGYEAQLCLSHRDPQKTGSLYNLAKVPNKLIPFDDTWFEQHVICRDVADGVHIMIRVNGVTVVDHIDKKRLHAKGHLAFQQHHVGSVVEFKDIQVRDL